MPGGDVDAVDADRLNDKCHNRKVRRARNKYLHNVPQPKQLRERADQQRSFRGLVVIVWARDEMLMLPARGSPPGTSRPSLLCHGFIL